MLNIILRKGGFMEAIRIIKKIDSDTLFELDKFMGQKVEIIIFPIEVIPPKNAGKRVFKKIDGLPDGLEFQHKLRNEWSS